MLDVLRFVQGAVAKKDFVPSLTHFRLQNGTIRGFNGALALCSPIKIDLDCNPKAIPFVKAIQACKDTIQLNMTPTGRLSIKSGNFRALVDCDPSDYPAVEPEGEVLPLNGDLLKVLRVLAPFIAEDASRPWARGILFRGESAFATNNIVLVERWLGYTFPVELNLPRSAVTELLRIGEEPTHLQLCANSVTFHFSGERWMRSQTYSTQWPDIGRILSAGAAQSPIPEGLWEAAEKLTPFVDDLGRLFFSPGKITTGDEEAAGASVEVSEILATGCFNVDQLMLLKGIAQKLDLSCYPAPCAFTGELLRGAIVGIRT